jgi:CBS domain-containing protein
MKTNCFHGVPSVIAVVLGLSIGAAEFYSVRELVAALIIFSILFGTPALVVVLAKSSGTQSAEDCYLAAENLMLAARNEGLGSCWIGFARPWLAQAKVRCLPVIDAAGKLQGILSIDDVVLRTETGTPKGDSKLSFAELANTLKLLYAPRPLRAVQQKAAVA